MKNITELLIPETNTADYKAQRVISSIEVGFKDTAFSGDTYHVDIIDTEYQKDFVTVFARAFTLKGEPVGFGADGSVEIERFRFFNPPLLVEDPYGDIKQVSFNDKKQIEEVRFFREDPKEALKESLLDTISKVAKSGESIVRGKIGNTTTTIYSDTSDAILRVSNATWSTARNATSSTVQSGLSTGYIASELEGATYNIYTGFWMFDTSVIPSTDAISSAVFSVSLNGDSATGDSQTLAVGNSTQATWNSPVSGDFDARGHTGSLGSSGVTHPNGATTGYLDFTLNATGVGWIARNGETIPGSASASGKTQLTLLYSSDTNDSTPTVRAYAQMRMVEQAGTTNDPKLTIVHESVLSLDVNFSGTDETTGMLLGAKLWGG